MDKQSTPDTQPILEEIKDNLENWRKTKTSIGFILYQKTYF
jgi:hypothetical protein